MRLLPKSRFKLELESPNKLYYIKKDEFANRNLEEKACNSIQEICTIDWI